MTASPTAIAAPELQEVADGVFAYVQPAGGWCVNNAGVIVSGASAALVDTAATEHRARLLRDHVLSVAPAAPSVLVNTHSHGDHTFGNYLFPEAVVVAHAQARREMALAGLHLSDLWPGVQWGEIEVALPTVTFSDTLTLHVGELSVELLHPGPAHTTHDVVAWLPEQRVLFTGDIVMSGATPFCQLGSIAGSLQVVDRLRALGAATVVSGHGPVAGPEVFDVVERYLLWVRELARAGLAAGLAPREAAREADLGEFADLLEPERLIPNLHRAYAEERGAAHGEPIDVGEVAKQMAVIFQEMVEYHGGPLDCHA